MKAQFLLISAVVAGVTMIALSTAVSEARSQDYSPKSQLPYHLDSIREEARKVDTNDQGDRRRFRRAVASLGYSSSVDFWASRDCFNVTLRSKGRSATVNCVG